MLRPHASRANRNTRSLTRSFPAHAGTLQRVRSHKPLHSNAHVRTRSNIGTPRVNPERERERDSCSHSHLTLHGDATSLMSDRPRKKGRLAPSRAELKLTAEIASAARRAHELHAKQTKLSK